MKFKYFFVAIIVFFLYAYLMPLHLINHPQYIHIMGGLIVGGLAFLGGKDIFNNMSEKKQAHWHGMEPLLFVIVCTIAILFLRIIFDNRVVNVLKKKGVETEVVVHSGEHRSIKIWRIFSNTYTVKLSFVDAKGKKKNIDANVSGNEFSALYVPTTVKMVYLPEDPKILRLLVDEIAKEFDSSVQENRNLKYEDILALFEKDSVPDAWSYLSERNSSWLKIKPEATERWFFQNKSTSEDIYMSENASVITYINSRYGMNKNKGKDFLPADCIVDSIGSDESSNMIYILKGNIYFRFKYEMSGYQVLPTFSFYKKQ